MLLYNFHIKHLKLLRHVSIFSEYHQGVPSFFTKVVVAAYHVVQESVVEVVICYYVAYDAHRANYTGLLHRVFGWVVVWRAAA